EAALGLISLAARFGPLAAVGAGRVVFAVAATRSVSARILFDLLQRDLDRGDAHQKIAQKIKRCDDLPVDSDAKCNPVDSIGSSTKSRVSHSEHRPSARFPGDKDGSARRNIEPLQ